MAETTGWLLLISLLLVGFSAFQSIASRAAGHLALHFVFKPLTTSLIIMTALVLPDAVPSPYKVLIVAGLTWSLAGDLFLMQVEDRFVLGLLSFLVAHILYVLAFALNGPWSAPGFLLVYLIIGAAVLTILWRYLGSHRVAVLVYVGFLLAMGWQAGGRWESLRTVGAALAALGAFLFMLSDGVLALNRFRLSVRHGDAVVLGAYFAGQWLIALSTGIG